MKPSACLRGHYEAVKSVGIKDNMLISFGYDGVILSWNIRTRRHTTLCRIEEIRHGRVWGNYFIILNSKRFVKIKGDGTTVHEMAVLPSMCNFDIHKSTAIINRNEGIELIDLHTFESVMSIKPKVPPTSLLLLEDMIVVGCEDGSVVIFDKACNLVQQVKCHVEPVMALYFDSGNLYSGGPDYFLTKYHQNSSKQIILPSNGVSWITSHDNILWIAGWKSLYNVKDDGELIEYQVKTLFNMAVIFENQIFLANENSRIYVFDLL